MTQIASNSIRGLLRRACRFLHSRLAGTVQPPSFNPPAESPQGYRPGSVRQVVRRAVSVVRLGLDLELDGPDGREPVEDRPGDAVHPVHDSAVGTEDDRVRDVHLGDEPDVLDDSPDSRDDRSVLEPVVGVDLGDRVEGYVEDGESLAQLDQSIDVPRVEAVLAGPEVVLLPQRQAVSPGRRPRSRHKAAKPAIVLRSILNPGTA